MRSNNFDVKVTGKKCTEVEAQANNYENHAKEFVNLGHEHNSFLSELLPQSTFSQRVLHQNYLTT